MKDQIEKLKTLMNKEFTFNVGKPITLLGWQIAAIGVGCIVILQFL